MRAEEKTKLLRDTLVLIAVDRAAVVGRMMRNYDWLKALLQRKRRQYYVEQCERDASRKRMRIEERARYTGQLDEKLQHLADEMKSDSVKSRAMDDKMMCIHCARKFKPTAEQVIRGKTFDAVYCPKCDAEIGPEIRMDDDRRSALVRQVLGMEAPDTQEK